MPEDYTIEIRSSGYAILVAMLMLVAAPIGGVGILLFQDFVIGEILPFDTLMWIELFTMAAVVIFVLRPAVIAYFTKCDLIVGVNLRVVGTGIVYKIPSSELIPVRSSPFVLRRTFGRISPDKNETFDIERVQTHQSAIERTFHYGTLILKSGEWAICLEFVDELERVASCLKSLTSITENQ